MILGSAGFQTAPESGETPALSGNWKCIYETDISLGLFTNPRNLLEEVQGNVQSLTALACLLTSPYKVGLAKRLTAMCC